MKINFLILLTDDDVLEERLNLGNILLSPDLHAPPLGQALAAHLLVRGQPAGGHLGSGGRQQVEEQRVLVVVLHRTRGRAAGHSLRPGGHQLAMLDVEYDE